MEAVKVARVPINGQDTNLVAQATMPLATVVSVDAFETDMIMIGEATAVVATAVVAAKGEISIT